MTALNDRSIRVSDRLRNGLAPVQQDVGLSETNATTIKEYVPNVVPGLFQTPPYAKALMAIIHGFYGIDRDIDDAVRARIERQQVLFDGKPIKIVFNESVLRNPPTGLSAPEMRAQVEKIASLLDLDHVIIGIVPLGTPMAVALPMNGYTLHEGIGPAGGRVIVSTVSSTLKLAEADDVELYRRHFDGLATTAVTGQAARALWARAANRWC